LVSVLIPCMSCCVFPVATAHFNGATDPFVCEYPKDFIYAIVSPSLPAFYFYLFSRAHFCLTNSLMIIFFYQICVSKFNETYFSYFYYLQPRKARHSRRHRCSATLRWQSAGV
jgi:hypothetical protein